MIKQLIIENIFNFKDEMIVDFTSSENKEVNQHIYNKEAISNLTLVYGKNNVGKSNLFKTLGEAKKFVLDGKSDLEAYKGNNNENSNSIFEVVIENNRNEIRYGFEVDISKELVLDEWMFSKVDKSTRETSIFERSEKKYSKYFSAADKKNIVEVKNDVLLLNYLNNMTNTNEFVTDTLDFFKSIVVVKCDEANTKGSFHIVDDIRCIYEDDYKSKVLNAFLKTSDLDIKEIQLVELTREESDAFMMIKNLGSQEDIEEEIRQKEVFGILSKNKNLFKKILYKNLFGLTTDDKTTSIYSLDFIHQSGAEFQFEELSSGTKQILSIVTVLINNMDNKKLVLFDEIENGLHLDLLILILDLINLIVKRNTEFQCIVSTHREDLLDIHSISNENKIFLKKDNQVNKVYVEYLSEFRMREYHVPSKRYRLNAFDANPNKSNEYSLIELLNEGVK